MLQYTINRAHLRKQSRYYQYNQYNIIMNLFENMFKSKDSEFKKPKNFIPEPNPTMDYILAQEEIAKKAKKAEVKEGGEESSDLAVSKFSQGSVSKGALEFLKTERQKALAEKEEVLIKQMEELRKIAAEHESIKPTMTLSEIKKIVPGDMSASKLIGTSLDLIVYNNTFARENPELAKNMLKPFEAKVGRIIDLIESQDVTRKLMVMEKEMQAEKAHLEEWGKKEYDIDEIIEETFAGPLKELQAKKAELEAMRKSLPLDVTTEKLLEIGRQSALYEKTDVLQKEVDDLKIKWDELKKTKEQFKKKAK